MSRKMIDKKPEITPIVNWKVFWLPLFLLALLMLLTPGLVTYRAVREYLSDQPLKVIDSWRSLVLLDLFFVGSGLVVLWDITRTFRTRFALEGIEQKGIFSNRSIPWNDIVSIQWERMIHLRISSPDKSIRILPGFISNWEDILNFIKSHLEKPYQI